MRRLALLLPLCGALFPAASALRCPYSHGKHVISSFFLKAEGASAPAPAATTPMQGQLPLAGDSRDPLVRLNALFERQYAAVGLSVLPSPAIVFEGDYVVLMRNTSHAAMEPVTAPMWHQLKMVSHMPLALFTNLMPYLDQPRLDGVARQRLVDYRTALKSVALTSDRFPTPDQLERQLKILGASSEFLDDVIAKYPAGVTSAQMDAYLNSLKAEIAENLKEATSASLYQLDAVMRRWKAEVLTAEEWRNVTIVVDSSHMARTDGMVAQYFARLMDVPVNECTDRMIILEGVSDEGSLFAYMGAHVTDAAVGDHFFESHTAMHRDITADAAKQIIDEIFSK